jgi:flagellar motility protein MotE (MotC chaperone)
MNIMNILKKALVAGGCAALLALGSNTVMAQGRGNFDPAQFKQDRMDRYRESLEIKDDAEWTAIEPKVSKVYDARAELMASAMRGAFGRGGRRGGGNGGAGGNADDNGGAQRRQRGGGPFGTPSAAVEALQKAIDDKAPTAEIKTKLKVVQDEFKANQAKLVASQEDLRSVLTPRQEAIATLQGLLQ